MSLDVSLILKTPIIKKGTGVFFRENGKTKELTIAEVREKFPKAVVEEITNNPNHNRVISEAKLIALKEFFDNLILIDEEIENLL